MPHTKSAKRLQNVAPFSLLLPTDFHHKMGNNVEKLVRMWLLKKKMKEQQIVSVAKPNYVHNNKLI